MVYDENLTAERPSFVTHLECSATGDGRRGPQPLASRQAAPGALKQKTQLELDLGRDATGEARSDPSQETEACAARPDIESRAAVGPTM
jgi:hypothetical protein